MPPLADIGLRVELVSMDAHFEEISLALYRQEREGLPVGLVHTFSPKAGAHERVAFVARAMTVLAGLEPAGADDVVRFPCGDWHAAAAKRAFLEACKADPAGELTPRPLEVVDRKTGQRIAVESLGPGAYRVRAEGATADTPSRAPAAARGLAKLAELEVGDDPEVVSFRCASAHDALVGLLLPRALNVRAAMQEEELKAARGVLVAPGAQEEAAG
jgi:hypothetical protein